jgi:hypothetical protein
VRILIGVLSDSAPRGCYQREREIRVQRLVKRLRAGGTRSTKTHCGLTHIVLVLTLVAVVATMAYLGMFSEVRLALAPKDRCRSGRRSA